MEIFKWLEDKSLIKSYSIHDFRKSETAYYMDLRIDFIDSSEIYIREYVDHDHRKYSFHWKKSNGELIILWDNAPHFPQLTTFPHHKHMENNEVRESHDITFDEVMKYIKERIAFESKIQ